MHHEIKYSQDTVGVFVKRLKIAFGDSVKAVGPRASGARLVMIYWPMKSVAVNFVTGSESYCTSLGESGIYQLDDGVVFMVDEITKDSCTVSLLRMHASSPSTDGTTSTASDVPATDEMWKRELVYPMYSAGSDDSENITGMILDWPRPYLIQTMDRGNYMIFYGQNGKASFALHYDGYALQLTPEGMIRSPRFIHDCPVNGKTHMSYDQLISRLGIKCHIVRVWSKGDKESVSLKFVQV